ALPSTHEVIHKRVAHYVQVSGADVVIPTGEIELLIDFVVVPVVGPTQAANVGSDELSRLSMRPDRSDLGVKKTLPCSCDKVAMLQHECGVTVFPIQRN